MNEKSFGGIIVKDWNPLISDSICFASDNYFLYRLKNITSHGQIPELSHYTLYSLAGELWNGEGKFSTSPLASNEFWYAGVKNFKEIKHPFLNENAAVYTVKKPWGAEFWLSGEHPFYCFKKIQLNKGMRTSLQFHREKQETNVIISGRVRLYYQKAGTAKEHIPDLSQITSIDLDAPVTMDIAPYTVHRIEALTDIEFLEISTPQVHDVIRISDDSKRENGRIESEHRK